ncbi:hypothetical protein [Mucilaginibacter agri]|uniref:MG2 domain-containing protein n=1 Tax=Mucilaginibacter agri TaxID=2695265 RepID=A0A966DU46_9SPHI|nr:hypothetical protein [Mucilaginibacter agri]NCD70046.1 hypothetical protein [Mucilaginibacter agri]
MKRFYSAIVIVPALMSTLYAGAQVLPQVQQSLNAYNSKAAFQEKLFVHTDKSFYITGEILWFKIYNTDAMENKPLDVSKVAYVEILDRQQNAVAQAKVKLDKSSGSGSLSIPITLSDGNYKLRAYTSWMKNFGPDFFFEKTLTIINPLKPSDNIEATKKALSYDVQFFPEGGTLVKGQRSKVAFKVTSNLGTGADNFNGAVLNQKNDTIARFKPLKFGMGSFVFTPQAGNTYHSVIVVNKTTYNKPFPIAEENGYTMQLTDNKTGQLNIEVAAANITDNELYLFANTGAKIKVAKANQLVNGKAVFTVNTADLGDGVSYLTIFNGSKQPVCERLYFKRPQQTLNIALNTDKQQYGLRNKVQVSIATKDNAKALPADLSMSVYQLDTLQKQTNADIQSYLWLSSELKGNIESPNYYFGSHTAESDEALDNLMLTQGWRRFNWNNVLSGKTPSFKFLPEFTGHLVTALITDSATKKPAENITAYLGIPGKRIQMYTAKSDAAGHLIFNTKDFVGPAEIVAQTNFEIDSTYHIEIQSPFSEQYSATQLPDFQLSYAVKNLLKQHSIEMQVQNIYSGNQMRSYYDPGVDSTAFYYKPRKTYKLDDYTRFSTMEEVLREYVKEVFVAKRKKRFNLDVLSTEGFLEGGKPLVMLDGVPIFNMDKVMTFDPLKIEKLEVIPLQYFYGPTNNLGVLSFTTYKGDFGGFEIDPRSVVMDYEGLQLERKFYAPVYDTEDKLNSRTPDYRNVLYWSPTAGTDTNGKNQLSFYTGDQPGKYIGVVQGISTTGAAGSNYVIFEVK